MIGEGFRNIFTHGFMSFASVTIIIACLIVMGSFTLLDINVNNIIDDIGNQNQILAYVDESMSAQDASAKLQTKIASIDNVADVEFVSRTEAKNNFMEKYDERLSLAPRDIVARAIHSEMQRLGKPNMFIDLSGRTPKDIKSHFPNIYAKCLSIGIDITREYMPVRPAAHYMCGGIKVDLNGQSSIKRLYAIGECSCTGLHGGNRLASNSLIEAVVYAETASKHSLDHIDEYDFNTMVPEWNDEGTMTNEEKVLITQSVHEVGSIMSNYVGIVRSDLRLKRAWVRLDTLYEETETLFKRVSPTKDICELRNMINVAYLITRWAIERKECRGLHFTTDYPQHAYDTNNKTN